jgi:hypothetical protein
MATRYEIYMTKIIKSTDYIFFKWPSKSKMDARYEIYTKDSVNDTVSHSSPMANSQLKAMKASLALTSLKTTISKTFYRSVADTKPTVIKTMLHVYYLECRFSVGCTNDLLGGCIGSETSNHT